LFLILQLIDFFLLVCLLGKVIFWFVFKFVAYGIQVKFLLCIFGIYLNIYFIFLKLVISKYFLSRFKFFKIIIITLISIMLLSIYYYWYVLLVLLFMISNFVNKVFLLILRLLIQCVFTYLVFFLILIFPISTIFLIKLIVIIELFILIVELMIYI